MVIHQVRSLALTLALLRSAHSAAACLREHLWAHARLMRGTVGARGDTAAGAGLQQRVEPAASHMDGRGNYLRKTRQKNSVSLAHAPAPARCVGAQSDLIF